MLATSVLLFSILNPLKIAQSYNFNQSSFYAGLSASLAKYFHSSCIFFLTDSRSEDTIFLEKVIKEIAVRYGESTNIYSFEEYHQHQGKEKTIQCYAPLQVVISHDNATQVAFSMHSQRNTMHGSYSVGGGVWLVFLDSLSSSYLSSYFEKIQTPFDVEMVVAELNQNDQMILKEVYRVREDRPLRSPSFGVWSQKAGLELSKRDHLYSRRNNLEGIVLNVGYVDSEPFIFKEIVDGEPVLGGYFGEIWESLEDSFNFTSNATLKKNYGIHNESGNWSGLMGAIQKNIFDAGIADFTLTQKRFEAVSYSRPLLITNFRTYYQSAGSTIDVDALFLPLALDLWAALIGWLLVAGICLYFGCYLSDKNLGTSENLSLQNSLFFVGGALCAQGGVRIPERFTCRILFFASFLITSVIIPSYSASLLSYLTTLPAYVPFRTMKQFYDLGNIRMAVKYSSYEYDLFSYDSSNDPYMSKIFKRDISPLDKDSFPRSIFQGIRTVCKNKQVAFFGLADAVNWALLQDEKREGRKRECSISNVPYDGGKVSVGIIFPKYSHYRGLFNYQLSYLPSNGILKRLRYKHWPITRVIQIVDEHKPVALQNLMMIFAILGTGFTGAVLFFILELQFQSVKLKKPVTTSNGDTFLDSKNEIRLNHTWVQRKRKHPQAIVFYYY